MTVTINVPNDNNDRSTCVDQQLKMMMIVRTNKFVVFRQHIAHCTSCKHKHKATMMLTVNQLKKRNGSVPGSIQLVIQEIISYRPIGT